ncbi:MAG TPA: flavin reductase family protein [Solimonas sp.]|nr:flavin reductase family protein [Solimonas sp.]
MSQTATPIDPQEFRKALGTFATGVTIITTRAPDGSQVGLTANSFNSVSLNPPLVLWSLANTSASLEIFQKTPYWAVHVLAADQEPLSTRFAKRGIDKFAGVDIEQGLGEIPLLRGCNARFQCRTAFQYEGGDHVIFVGEVLAFDRAENAPLVFHSGRYAHAAPRSGEKPRNPALAGSFNEDFLGYLLGRSHFQFFSQIRKALGEVGLSDEEFYLLSTLTLKRIMSADELDAGMSSVLGEHSDAAAGSLIRRGLARSVGGATDTEGPAIQLTSEGSTMALRLISAAKAVESQLLERLGPGEAAMLKSLLHRLLGAIDPGASLLWQTPDVKAAVPTGA